MATCRDIAGDVSAGRLSAEEIEEIFDDLSTGNSIERGKVLADEAKMAALIERRNRLMNIVVERRLMAFAELTADQLGDPALGLQAKIVGINAPIKGAQESAYSLASGLEAQYVGGLSVDLRRAGVETQFARMSGDMEREVARALEDLNRKNPVGVKVSRDAMEIAKVMQKYQEAARVRENRAGAYIGKRDGYITRQSHDAGKMVRAGLEEWKNTVRGLLDFEKMGIGIDRIEDYLDSAYEAISTGIRLTNEVSEIERAFKGPGNIAKKESAHRSMVFKNADAWIDYNTRFGTGNLREAYIAGLNKSARAAGVMTNFGTNPEAMLDRVTEKLKQKYRNDPAKLKGLKGGLENLKHQMAEVTGDVNLNAGSTVAQVTAGMRALQSLTKLGSAFVSSLTDISATAANRAYQGRGAFEAWGDALTSAVEGMSGGQKREFADLLGAGMEGMLGEYTARFHAQDTVPGRVSKLMGLFFKLNLLGPWTYANKRGVTLMIARDLANNAGKAFDELSPEMRRLLSLYEIEPKHWNIARKAVRTAGDGRTYLMPGDIADVRGAEFTGLSKSQQDRLRDTVRDRVFALMATEADFAVPTPGARERAIMRRGYTPGTFGGEALRFMGQFKSFPITFMTKVLGRNILGREIGKKSFANMGVVNSIVGATILGYFVVQAKEMLKGRSPRPFDQKMIVAAMLQGGGAGIYGDFLFGSYNRFGGGALETIAGPAIGELASLVDTFTKFREGEGGAADIIRLVKGNIPMINLFYTKAALDYLVWYRLQEAANPGYLRRMEQRIKRENDQTFMVPPSRVVGR